jgi:hypothetical protein
MISNSSKDGVNVVNAVVGTSVDHVVTLSTRKGNAWTSLFSRKPSIFPSDDSYMMYVQKLSNHIALMIPSMIFSTLAKW